MIINAATQATTRWIAGILLILTMCLLPLAETTAAENEAVPSPGSRDICPVCGMFVAKFPEWVASVLYADGVGRHFDGPKDMFKYLLKLSKYEPQRQASDIKSIVVTEYYDLSRIDARQAFYVTGSDVLGPMGHELIPLASGKAAQEFMKDHQGNHILRFDQIDLGLLKRLDEGTFE